MKISSFPHRQPDLLERTTSFIRIVALLFAGIALVGSNFARGESDSLDASQREGSASSLSASGSAAASVKVTRDARGRKVQYVDFSEAVIEGKARAPEGFVIQSRASGRFNSLIELRKNFRENIEVQALEAATLPPASE